MSENENIQVQFEQEKETKNTIRFNEVEGDGPPVIGTLYVQKYILRRLGNPDTLTVTIEPGK